MTENDLALIIISKTAVRGMSAPVALAIGVRVGAAVISRTLNVKKIKNYSACPIT